MPQLNSLGILLGSIFGVGFGAFCFWAFRTLPTPSSSVAKVRPDGSKTNRIVVPVMPLALGEEAVERACRWGPARARELILVYVIVVPDILTLDAPLPEQDQAANAALDRAYAIAKERGLPARLYIVRQRNVADGILQVAREEQADVIMLSVGRAPDSCGPWERTSGQIMHQANCEVVVDRAAA